MSNFDPGHLFQYRDHVLLQLFHDVVAHVLRRMAVGGVGDVEHHRGALVLLPEQLEPLHEGEAPGIAEEQHIRVGERLPVGCDVPLRHHADVRLHVGADVLGVPRPLGLGDHLAGFLPHRVLDRVDLREVVRDVEAHEELVQVPRDEGGGDLGRSTRDPVVVPGDHLLLHHLRIGLDDFRLAHDALHSLMESAKVPDCSRIGCIWLEFSAYCMWM